jgi:hypothetical protein
MLFRDLLSGRFAQLRRRIVMTLFPLFPLFPYFHNPSEKLLLIGHL